MVKTGIFDYKLLTRPIPYWNRSQRELMTIVFYKRTDPMISELDLMAYSDKAIRLDLKIHDKTQFDTIKAALELQNFEPFICIETHLGIELSCSRNRPQRFAELLNVIQNYVDITEISNELIANEASIMERESNLALRVQSILTSRAESLKNAELPSSHQLSPVAEFF